MVKINNDWWDNITTYTWISFVIFSAFILFMSDWYILTILCYVFSVCVGVAISFGIMSIYAGLVWFKLRHTKPDTDWLGVGMMIFILSGSLVTYVTFLQVDTVFVTGIIKQWLL